MDSDRALAAALMRARCNVGMELVRLVIEDGVAGNMDVADEAKLERNRLTLHARMVAVAGSEDLVIETLRDLCHQTWGTMQGFAGGLASSQEHRTEEDRRILGGLAIVNDLAKTAGDVRPDDRRAMELNALAVHTVFRSPEAIIHDLHGLFTRVQRLIHDIADLEGIDCQCSQNPAMSNG